MLDGFSFFQTRNLETLLVYFWNVFFTWNGPSNGVLSAMVSAVMRSGLWSITASLFWRETWKGKKGNDNSLKVDNQLHLQKNRRRVWNTLYGLFGYCNSYKWLCHILQLVKLLNFPRIILMAGVWGMLKIYNLRQSIFSQAWWLKLFPLSFNGGITITVKALQAVKNPMNSAPEEWYPSLLLRCSNIKGFHEWTVVGVWINTMWWCSGTDTRVMMGRPMYRWWIMYS